MGESSSVLILVNQPLAVGTSRGGSYTVDRASDKIDYLHNYIVVMRSGISAQSQNAAHKVRFLIDSHTIEQGKLPHVRTAARMVQKINYEKQLEAGFIVAGWDPYEGPQIYMVNHGGACLKREWGMGGSGSGYLYGYCDANFKSKMSCEEAKQFCLNAVLLAMRRDGSSGGAIRLANITERGLEREYHTCNSLSSKPS
jgi:20S proteasome subunit beta 1